MVACDGGSAIDAGKAIAAVLGNGSDPLDYLEVVGRGRPIALPSVPFVAIPTTAGTGSEVTRNAVVSSPEHRVKASLRSPLMLPRAAIVDPDRYREIAAIVTGRPGADAADGVAWVESLVRALEVPGLSHWGASASDVPALVAKARAASSMKGNPVELDEAELAEIVDASL